MLAKAWLIHTLDMYSRWCHATVPLYQFVTRSCVPSSLQRGRTWPLKHSSLIHFLMNVSRLGTSPFHVLAFNFTTNAWKVTLENCQQKSWQRIIKSLSLALQPQSSLKSFPGSQLAFSTRSPSTCMKKANCSAAVVLYLLKLHKALY